jgi:hypothetical protein
MLAGEVQRRRVSIERLTAEQAELQRKVDAFDQALRLCDDRVDPQAGGAVQATREQYGGRGALIQFVRDQVLDAGALGIDSVALTLQAIARFRIPVESRSDVHRYRDTILWCLRRLASQGVIESLRHSRGGHVPSVWCRKRTTALADLAVHPGS